MPPFISVLFFAPTDKTKPPSTPQIIANFLCTSNCELTKIFNCRFVAKAPESIGRGEKTTDKLFDEKSCAPRCLITYDSYHHRVDCFFNFSNP